MDRCFERRLDGSYCDRSCTGAFVPNRAVSGTDCGAMHDDDLPSVIERTLWDGRRRRRLADLVDDMRARAVEWPAVRPLGCGDADRLLATAPAFSARRPGLCQGSGQCDILLGDAVGLV
jgi:hypothetical protein